MLKRHNGNWKYSYVNNDVIDVRSNAAFRWILGEVFGFLKLADEV